MSRLTPLAVLVLVGIPAGCRVPDPPGGPSPAATVGAEAGEEPAAPAPPATRSLLVLVGDREGRPLPGVLVWCAPAGDPLSGVREPTSVAGACRFDGLPADEVLLCALPGGYVVPSKGMALRRSPLGEAEVSLVLDPGLDREVRVLDWPVGRAAVAYLAAEGDLEPSQHGIEGDGTLRIEGLRPGVSYDLYVRDTDSGRAALLRSLPSDGPWPEIEMAPCGEVTGRVLFPEGGDDANVAILVGKAVMIESLGCDGDGTFRIPCVPAGRWTVVAYATVGDRYVASTAEAEPGEAITVDLRRR